jgi:hypothetical protein
MSIRLNGSTSGYTEIDAPAVAGSNTLVLPTGNGSADQALVTNGSGTLSFADRGRMTLATAQNSTSGTSIDFTGIPSWVKRVTVMFNGVSTNGSSVVQVQLGTSSGVTASGYLSAAWAGGSSNAGSTSTTGFAAMYAQAAASTMMGHLVITNISGNSFIASGAVGYQPTTANIVTACAGNVTLSSTLDRVRITTVNGTDTFDAGSINILYEG